MDRKPEKPKWHWIMPQDPNVLERILISQRDAVSYDLILKWTREKLTGVLELVPGDFFWNLQEHFYLCVQTSPIEFICLTGQDHKPETFKEHRMTTEQIIAYLTRAGYFEYDYCGHHPDNATPLYQKFLRVCKK